MNTLTVYKAMAKKAGSIQPSSPEGGLFKRRPLPDLIGKPITAPGSQPLASAEQAPQPPQPASQSGVDAKMLEKGWEKTMEAMQNITAMNNGMPPQTAPAAQPPAGPEGQPGPGMPPPPPPELIAQGAGGAPMPPMLKHESLDLGIIYKNMMEKKAFFEGATTKKG